MTVHEQLKHLELRVSLLEEIIKNKPESKAPEVYFKFDDNFFATKEYIDYHAKYYDTPYIDKVIEIICTKYRKYYGLLDRALGEWLKIDPKRPEEESRYLIDNGGYPPVAEQLRLWPNRIPVTMDTLQRKQSQKDIIDREKEWRAEIEKEDKLKSDKQLAKEERERKKLLQQIKKK